MNEQKKSNAPIGADSDVQAVDPHETVPSRREFLKKYGKYAAVTPVALGIMMHSGQVSAATSDGF